MTKASTTITKGYRIITTYNLNAKLIGFAIILSLPCRNGIFIITWVNRKVQQFLLAVFHVLAVQYYTMHL